MLVKNQFFKSSAEFVKRPQLIKFKIKNYLHLNDFNSYCSIQLFYSFFNNEMWKLKPQKPKLRIQVKNKIVDIYKPFIKKIWRHRRWLGLNLCWLSLQGVDWILSLQGVDWIQLVGFIPLLIISTRSGLDIISTNSGLDIISTRSGLDTALQIYLKHS